MNVQLAISKAGHDMNQIYVIVQEVDGFVYLCDGNLKKIDKPKKKNKKHIQCIKKLPKEIEDLFQNSHGLKNEDVKRVLKLYCRNRNDKLSEFVKN